MPRKDSLHANETWEIDSPFLREELFSEPRDEWRLRGSAIGLESPFQGFLEVGRDPLEFRQSKDSNDLAGDYRAQGETWNKGAVSQHIERTADAPWRWICKITVRHRGKEVPGGTGVLISPRHILTAAHVVYEQYIRPGEFSIEVTPGLNGLHGLAGPFPVSMKPKVPDKYKGNPADPKIYFEWDYALLTLNERISEEIFPALSGRPLCYWGHPSCGANTVITRLDPRSLSQREAFAAGYPAIKGGKQLWNTTGLLFGAHWTRRWMGFTATLTKGQSGSPVWVRENGKYCLVGIAVMADTQKNIVRVTQEVLDQVQSWIRLDEDNIADRQLPEYFEETRKDDRLLLDRGESNNLAAEVQSENNSEEELLPIEEPKNWNASETLSRPAYPWEVTEMQEGSLEPVENETATRGEREPPHDQLSSEVEDEDYNFESEDDPYYPRRHSPQFEVKSDPTIPSLRGEIARIADIEWERWGRGETKETDSSARNALLDYWSTVRSSAEAEKAINEGKYWSAAFISYVMKQAGANQSFKYSAGHFVYVSDAKKWRNVDTSKFWAYEISETRPEVGDLVCKDRKRCVKRVNNRCVKWRCADTTFDNIGDSPKTGRPAHCDVVVSMDLKKNRIRVIGGNVSNSVGARWITLDSNGFLPHTAFDGCKYIAVVKPPRGEPVSEGVSSLPRETLNIGQMVIRALISGENDVNKLTNMLFYARHSDLPVGYKIQRHEKKLGKDWLQIKERVVTPLLGAVGVKSSNEAQSISALQDSSWSSLEEGEVFTASVDNWIDALSRTLRKLVEDQFRRQWTAFKTDAVTIARQELGSWSGRVEGDPWARTRLEEYARAAKVSDPIAWAGRAANDSVAWSAAFICFVMREARNNTQAPDLFVYNEGHDEYIRAAKTNATNDVRFNPFWLLNLHQVRPERGDLLCKNRRNGGISFDLPVGDFAAHVDLVTGVQPNQLVTVGGNVGETVQETIVNTVGGFVTLGSASQASGRYFAILRVRTSYFGPP